MRRPTLLLLALYSFFLLGGSAFAAQGPLSQPIDLALGTDRIYVAEQSQQQVDVLNSQGQLVRIIGKGILSDPVSVASTDGKLFILDHTLEKVLVFTPQGQLLRRFGRYSFAYRPGTFFDPRAIAAAPDGTLWEADGTGGEIEHWSSGGRYLGGWGERPQDYHDGDHFADASSVAVGANGDVYATDAINSNVKAFDPRGHLLFTVHGKIAGKPLDEPLGLAAAGDDLYVSDAYRHRSDHDGHERIIELNALNGHYLRSWGRPCPACLSGTGTGSSAAGAFYRPGGLAACGDHLYVADILNNRLQAFSVRGRYLGQSSGSGGLPRRLCR